MPFARTYESWEVRALMQKSEGSPSPVTGADAHARVLHAAKTTSGKLSQFGTTMLDRTHKRSGESNNQWKNRSGAPKTSAFDNLIFQSAAVTQAFNSTTGQAALAVFDDPAHSGKNLRMKLMVAGIGESDFIGTGRGPGMRASDKNTSTVTTVPGAAGVTVIVDRGPSSTEPFIQTCYPLDTCQTSSYSVSEVPGNVVAQG